MLKAGDKAPDFSLPSSDMEMKSLGDYANKWLLLYFYPKDDTPGCTIQATDFTDMLDDYCEAGIEIVGVSGDNCIDHQAFRDKYGLLVTLLADVERETCADYGVLHERKVGDEIRTGIMRSTFVIDPAGIVRYSEYSVAPKDHAKNMLPKIQAMMSV